MNRMGILAAVLTVVVGAGQAMADDARLAALEQRVNEMTAADSGSAMDKIRISGYGELHYSNPDNGDDVMDQHRMVVGVGYDYSESITMDMEIDYEHAATELELEFAQINFLVNDAVSARAGVLLMPVGALNDTHEPTLYYSVERPYLQRTVIPTTWSEGGAGIFGAVGDSVAYSVYVVSGLDAHGFTGKDGIRGGRQHAAEAIANDLGVVGRVSASPVKGVTAGISGYQGDASQDDHSIDGQVSVSLVEVDVAARMKFLELKAAMAQISLDDTAALNSYFAAEAALEEGATAEVVGEEIAGWNVEAAAHLYAGAPKRFLQDVVAFIRYETFNTQDEMAEGFSANPAYDREVVTTGVAYYPITEVAVKLDVEDWSNEAGDSWNVVNAGLAFVY